ncbi:MAG TPA: S8 family serine peptidase [Bdellovibrionales bacterium]|nr:S8 family serine peptidase [Bdellovibrionales bacterium]
MRKWLVSIFAVSGLAACAQNGQSGSSGGGFDQLSCKSPNEVLSTAQSIGGSDDPFSSSKLVLDRSGGAPLHNDYDHLPKGTVDAQSTPSIEVLPAGTELTVALKETCDASGEISSAIRKADPKDEQEQGEERAVSPAAVRSYTWKLPKDIALADLQKKADADSCVYGISESTIASVSALPADPMVSQQKHLKAIGLDQISTGVRGAAPVVIAVIDTGIDLRHEDLKNVLWKNTREIPGNYRDDDRNGYADDVYGYNFPDHLGDPSHQGSWSGFHHGTHVAGLAAAQAFNSRGGSGVIGSNAKIMALNVFGESSGAYSADIANAIRYAVDNGADIINMSVGAPGGNAAYQSAIAYALSKGVIMVAAAGNDGRALTKSFFLAPAGYGSHFAGLISVGSVDSDTDAFSFFSNFSPIAVEIAAPGAEDSENGKGLLSTLADGGYDRMMGTSMATPVATGGAALALGMMRSRGYDPSPATIEAILEVSAKQNSGLKQKIRNGRVIDLKQMSEFVENAYPRGGSGDPGVPGFDPCAVAAQ